MMRFAVGVDLGGTNLRIAAIEESGQLLDKVSVAVRALTHRDAVIDELCRAVRTLSARHAAGGTFAGVGVGVPGLLYAETGTLRKSPNLPGWENFAVRDAIRSQVEVEVVLDNDANAAALGEKWLGAGREVSSLCLLTLGTGVGGGLVLDGKVWRGFLGMAGEVGHIAVAENGVQCGCGSWGCLETEASATAVVRNAKKLLTSGGSATLTEATKDGRALTAELVYHAAQAGDAACREIFESFGRFLGIGLAILVNTLNLPLYVIGGGVAEAWPLFSPAMFDQLRRRSYVFAEGSTRVELAKLGADAGLYGAAYLALQKSK
ncbi:MAG: ROK family protein [Acidobacteria bacterium]|nr:ROK family protein [Acidobacteriota bacterium]